MKNQLHLITILVILLGSFASIAQKEVYKDTVNGKVVEYKGYTLEQFEEFKKELDFQIKQLEDEHDLFVSDRKTIFKRIIEKVNESLDKGDIDLEKAEKIKQEQAADLAGLIDAHRKKIDTEIELLRINRASVYYDFKLEGDQTSSIEISTKKGISIDIDETYREQQKYINTYSGFSLSFGYNFMNGDNLGINDFSYPNNNYFAIGYKWKTTLDKNKNNFRLVYGVEYQSHGTELNGSRFITQGDQSLIAPLASNLPEGASVSKAKFRQDQIVFPLHLEIGGSKRKEYEDGRVRFSEDDYWRVGLGGFAGFNTSSRLKLKYELDGRDIKETRINNFDNEKFIYGLDAYVGKDAFTFFGRMNLNNVFNSNSVDAQYITFGIRFQ